MDDDTPCKRQVAKCSKECQCGTLHQSELLADLGSQAGASQWRMDESVTYSPGPLCDELYRPDILGTISITIDRLSPVLRDISLHIHAHPELGFQEKLAHNTLTEFMATHGFSVTPHFLSLDTAWRAVFSHGSQGRVIGVNSEMDALPGIGHACGHNLIAVAGLATAVAIKTAMVQYNISGTVVLLGTPAEENGGGKIILLERGAYKDMDACLMCHPFSGPIKSMGVGTTTARQVIEVEYFGRASHAAGAPWQGQNALDAAFLAYAGLSALRQQLEPGAMSHGTIFGRDWTPNVIPDYAKLVWMIRGHTSAQVATVRKQVRRCFEGAAVQADCRVEIVEGQSWNELRQNRALALDFVRNAEQGFGVKILSAAESSYGASTDFGSVTYELPSIHTAYAVPSEPDGGNHTPAFARAAQTEEAHDATLVCAKSLALTGLRLLNDPDFFEEVKGTFEAEKASMAEL